MANKEIKIKAVRLVESLLKESNVIKKKKIDGKMYYDPKEILKSKISNLPMSIRKKEIYDGDKDLYDKARYHIQKEFEDYTDNQKSHTLPFGKRSLKIKGKKYTYQNAVSKNLISKVTLENLKKIESNLGVTWKDVYVCPVYQYNNRPPGYKIVNSIFLVGVDKNKNEFLYARKETSTPGFGTTYIQSKNSQKLKVTEIIRMKKDDAYKALNLVESLLKEVSSKQKINFIVNSSKVNKNIYNILLDILNAFNKGLKKGLSVTAPQIFNTGVTGVLFTINHGKEKYALNYSTGTIGLENQDSSNISFQKIGSKPTIIYKEKDSGSFGDVGLKNKDGALKSVEKIAKDLIKESHKNLKLKDKNLALKIKSLNIDFSKYNCKEVSGALKVQSTNGDRFLTIIPKENGKFIVNITGGTIDKPTGSPWYGDASNLESTKRILNSYGVK